MEWEEATEENMFGEERNADDNGSDTHYPEQSVEEVNEPCASRGRL